MSRRFCELKGGDTAQADNAGIPLQRCPSYCQGEEMVIVERPLLLDKIGPVVPKIGFICAEVTQPQVKQWDSLLCLYVALRDVIKDHKQTHS